MSSSSQADPSFCNPLPLFNRGDFIEVGKVQAYRSGKQHSDRGVGQIEEKDDNVER
eukprot:CAMPEP_0118673278 /NCGR_PEP_ID=MMETSP0800-20121206/229_1 /TAXON_ID=210618 ORGANISM="Striatella unipunctata, Strain CCMP2910" /NCGR_SAMPLE_ID=MMETSP0800 /ASSEMBLY_ACC=CAM_ASM_000638 /LENGTH=55 /DNA_ID=CAMNT_0006568315 /DNA_START=348 /DNA_END=515 /DNA_ORIENTATION=+